MGCGGLHEPVAAVVVSAGASGPLPSAMEKVVDCAAALAARTSVERRGTSIVW